MTRSKESQFPSRSFGDRLSSMLRVDARRMFATSLFWICLGISFAIPVLVLVMTSMNGHAESGQMFSGTWQIIATEGGNMMAAMGSAMGSAAESTDAASAMDMTSMMNINLMYFMMAVFTCLFVAEDFRSGYAKNLFAVRAGKADYVASKTIICFIAGAMFLTAFFIGAVIGGSVAGLSFDLGSAGISGLVMCMLAKIFLSAVFVAIFVLMSACARHRSWLSVCLSLFGGMLLFIMVPMMTPLDSGIGNVGMCLAGGSILALGIGAVSSLILKHGNLIG